MIVKEPCGCEWDTEPFLTYLRGKQEGVEYVPTKFCESHSGKIGKAEMTPEEGLKWIRTFGMVKDEFYVLVYDEHHITELQMKWIMEALEMAGIRGVGVGTNQMGSLQAIHVNRDDIAELKKAILALPEKQGE